MDQLDDREVATETRDTTKIDREVDRIFPGPLPDISIRQGPRLLTVRKTAGLIPSDLSDRAERPVPCDVVFWNPWIAKAKRTSDLGDEEYKNFTCIEPGLVVERQKLETGESLRLSQEISISTRKTE